MEAEVLFDYVKSQEDELDLKIGDIITDVQQVDEGWCEGYKNGIKGMFPDNFVKLIQPAQPPLPVQRLQLDPPPPIRDTTVNKKKRAKVTFSYTADNEDEISLEPGQIVEVIDEEEEGWWRGINNGKEGLFPSNFVDLITTEEPVAEQPPPPAPKPEKTRPPSMIAMPGLGGVSPLDLKNKLKPVSSASSKSSVPPPDTSSHHPAPPSFERTRSNTGSRMAHSSVPKAKVMFGYTATQDDEISVAEGDIVEIVDRDTDQDGWWMIRKGGNKGLVPDNFLEALPVEKPPVSEPKIDNPPLPPKKVEAPKPSGVPLPGSRSVLPKLPEKHDLVEPPPPAVKPEANKDELEVPHNGVLDSHLLKQRPKKSTGRPPSKSNLSEETIDSKVPDEDDETKNKKPVKLPLSTPNPPAPSTTPNKAAPGTRPKPSKATKPPPTLNKPPPPSSSTAGGGSGSTPSKSTSVGALSQVEKPSPFKSHEPKATPTAPPTVETQRSVSNDEWKEAFQRLQDDYNKFKEEIKEDMRILVQDLDDERKKNAQLLIDVDRLKKTAGFREKI